MSSMEKAFPAPYWSGDRMGYLNEGMTLRDYFAAKAMHGLIASPFPDVSLPSEIAETAYLMADAMIKERSK